MKYFYRNSYILYTILSLLFMFFVVLPVLNSIKIAFFNDDFLKNIKSFDKKIFLLLLKSVGLSLIVAVFSTFWGIVIGFLLYKTTIKYKKLFKLLILLPLFISPYILAVAWKDFYLLFFPTMGKTTTYIAVILVHSTIFIPLSILITGSAMVNISRQIEESAIMTAGLRKTIVRIVLPLIKPSIITSVVLIFIFSISEFSLPAYFGIRVLTTEIFIQFSAFYNHSLAILQSLLLTAVCIFLLLSEQRYIVNLPFLSINTRGNSSKIYDLKKYSSSIMTFIISIIFIISGIPFFVLAYQSFQHGTGDFIKAFSLLLPAFGNSAFLAFSGAFLSLTIGFVAAYYHEYKGFKLLDWLLMIVFAIPSIVFGISLIKFYNNPALGFIYSGMGIILIGYTGKYGFIASKMISNALKQIPSSLIESAKIQGIGLVKRLYGIIIPLVLPSIFASFIIIFLFCFGDLGTTIMVYPPGTEILPVKVFTIMANASASLTASMSLIVFLVTILFISVFLLIFEKNYRKQNVDY